MTRPRPNPDDHGLYLSRAGEPWSDVDDLVIVTEVSSTPVARIARGLERPVQKVYARMAHLGAYRSWNPRLRELEKRWAEEYAPLPRGWRPEEKD